MASVILIFGCFVGFCVASVQGAFFGASFAQAFMTYMTTSVSVAVVIGLSAWASSMIPRTAKRSAGTAVDDLQQWQEWQQQEDIDAAEYAAWQDAFREERIHIPKRWSA